jgi:NhaP-type Na+/H+ or K+/H+ antiporter
VKHVPLPIRQILLAESAANDGLAYPFLSIAVYLTTEASRETAFEKWLVISLLCPWTNHTFLLQVLIYRLDQVILGTVIGAVIGTRLYDFGCLETERFHRLLILSLVEICSSETLPRSGVVHSTIHRPGVVYSRCNQFTWERRSPRRFCCWCACISPRYFICSFLCVGSAISWDGDFNLQTENDAFSSILDLVLNCACFIYIGAWLPFDRFDISELGISPWRLVLLMLVILALRRIPSLLILYKLMPEVSNWREALFCGHFGPVSL